MGEEIEGKSGLDGFKGNATFCAGSVLLWYSTGAKSRVDAAGGQKDLLPFATNLVGRGQRGFLFSGKETRLFAQ